MPNIILAGSARPENIWFVYFLNLLFIIICLFVCFWITLGDATKRDMLTFTTLLITNIFFSSRTKKILPGQVLTSKMIFGTPHHLP